ncbi:MAG: molybdate ABC transporter substrate-binding protein, partial [Myxococcales bacterium]
MLTRQSIGGHVPRTSPHARGSLRDRHRRDPGRLPCGARDLVRILWLLASPFVACAEPREVLVGAAASLAEPMAVVVAAYGADRPELRMRLVVGASNVLAEQMRAGAPIDLLVSADPRVVDRLAADAIVDPARRVRLAGNRLVVLVRPGLRIPVASAEQLVSAEIRRVALPDTAVPVGRYARDWLSARGLLAPLEPRLVATADARATLVAVDAGDVDAAIVYATDARLASSALVAFEIAADEQPEIVYEAALGSRAGDEARDF